MVIIRISYEQPEELQKVLKRFDKVDKKVKISAKQEGKYKKAYIELLERKSEKT